MPGHAADDDHGLDKNRLKICVAMTTLRVRRAGKEQDITVKVGVAPFLFLDSGNRAERFARRAVWREYWKKTRMLLPSIAELSG